MYDNKLSSKLKVKALTKSVQYRLLAAGRVDLLYSKKPMCPSSVSYRAESVIYDEGDGQEKTLRYVTKTTPNAHYPGGLEPVVAEIEWPEGGVMTVTPTQVGLYEYMERDNQNASNPYRSTNRLAVYERVDPVSKAQALNAEDDDLFEAIGVLRGMSPEQRLELALASNLVQQDDDTILITRALNNYAKTNPKAFVKAANSPETKTRATITQALDWRILTYHPNTATYKWADEGADLFVVPQGLTARDELFKYLLSSEAKAKVALKELTNRVAKANGAK